MKAFIHISQANASELERCIKSLGDIVSLGNETRTNHTAAYPTHNRYFSNGDKPWVILLNLKNIMKLTYNNIEYIINENELVCFDDNIPHAWEMHDNDMTIYYYRGTTDIPVQQGTYCIDGFDLS